MKMHGKNTFETCPRKLRRWLGGSPQTSRHPVEVAVLVYHKKTIFQNMFLAMAMAGPGWPSRPAMAMASHDRPWPTMAGRGWSSPVNGRSMVSQGPNEHSFSILMLEARKFHQKIRLESENRNAIASVAKCLNTGCLADH